MGFRSLRFFSVSALLVTPAVAQFGIPMRKKGTTFEDLNEQASKGDVAKKGAGAAGGMPDMGDLAAMFDGVDMSQMQDMWKNAMQDPEMMKQMEMMGGKFEEALQELSKMSPEQLQQQMAEAMNMITDGDMASQIIDKKDEVLASLEQTGMVTAEELAKFKADPEYFELKMRESFDQMKGVFSDPKMIQGAMDAMKGSQNMMQEMTKAFTEGLDTDEKIEEARLEILKNPEVTDNPMLKGMFDTPEFKEVLNDPLKWRESIKEGQQAFASVGAGAAAGKGEGAGVGEL